MQTFASSMYLGMLRGQKTRGNCNTILLFSVLLVLYIYVYPLQKGPVNWGKTF